MKNLFTKISVFIIFYSIIFFNAQNVYTQNFIQDAIKKGKCKKFVKWTEQVSREYPNDNMDRLHRSKQLKLIYNLYSDKYFVPIFDKPFASLSDNKRTNLYNSGRRCSTLRPYSIAAPLHVAKWVPNKIFSYETTKTKAQEINILRNEFSSIITNLNNSPNDFTLTQINGYKNDLKRKYSVLLESEINLMSKLITSKESVIAEFEISSKLNQQLSEPNTYQTLQRLDKFKSINHYAISKLTLARQTKIDSDLNNKTIEILIPLMAVEKEKINNISLNVSGIEMNNKLYINFDNKYTSFRKFNKVQEVYDDFRKNKSEIVLKNSSILEDKIKSATTVGQLNSLSKSFLSHSDFSNTTIKVYDNKIESKIKLIKQTELKLKKEEQLRRQHLADEQKRLKAEKESAKLREMLDEKTPTGEPTDAQMKFAVVYQLQAANQSINNLSNGKNPNNSFGEKFQEIVGMMYKGTKVSLKSFDKYACVKAVNKPGYNCDYLAELEIRGGLGDSLGSNQFFNNFTGAEVKTARFLKVKGYWMIVQFLK